MNKKIHRPFVQNLQVYCRYYSRPLQRALTDFGADISFGQAVEKMKEHYGIEVSPCVIRKITEKHANKIIQFKPKEKENVEKEHQNIDS